MSCPVCGAQNEAGAAFCYRCGSALKPAASVTGPTVNLGRADTPTFGTPVAQPHDDTGARVYDVPTTASVNPTFSPAGSEMSLPPSPVSGTPQYTVPQAPGYAVSGQAPNSNSALISMILGIVSLGMFALLLCTFVLMPLSALAGIPAVIVGRNARKEIRASGGQIAGDGMAVAGMVMGWISIALSVIAAIGLCAFFAIAAAQSS